MDFKTAKSIYNQMLSAYRQSQEPIDRDLQKFIDPTRGAFSTQENYSKKMDGQTLVDTVTIESAEAFASGVMSFMTDPTKAWVKFEVQQADQKNQVVIDYLAKVGTEIRRIISGSNIYQELLNLYAELAVFGRGVMVITRDLEKVIHAYFYTAGSYVIQKNAKNEIDSFAVTLKKTVAQLVDEFGIENVGAQVKDDFLNNSISKYYDMIWLIIPNSSIQPSQLDHRGKKYSSLKWLVSRNNNDFLSVSGFDFFPVVCARYSPKDCTQIYGGKYPGWLSLSASRQLQEQVRAGNRIDAFNSDPAIVTYGIDIEDIYPGASIPFDMGMAESSGNKYGVESIYPQRDSTYLEAKADRQRDVIQRNFQVQFFQMLSRIQDKSMTLGEVNMRYSEMVKAISPQIMSVESALHSMLDIIFHTLLSTWVIIDDSNMTLLESLCGPIPQELQDKDVSYKLIGVLSILQQASETLPDEQLVQFTTYLASANQSDPINNPVDYLSFDEVLKGYANHIGRGELLRGDDEVQKIRDARTQAYSQQQQQQDSQNAIKSAQAMAQTPIAQNTALGAVMGQQGVI